MSTYNNTYPQFEGLGLTAKQQAFVIEYCAPSNGFSATHAYAKAYGLDLKTQYDSAKRSASRLLSTNVHIMAAIDAERARILERNDDLADSILRQWYIMATIDVTQFFDIHGHMVSLKELSEIPPYMLNCIKSLKTTAHGIEVIFYDKNRALENLAKALGMFKTVVHNTNEPYESLVQKIDRQRREKRYQVAQK